jgi:hypothetical protein
VKRRAALSLTGGHDAAMLEGQKDFAMTQTAPHPAGFDFAAAFRGQDLPCFCR